MPRGGVGGPLLRRTLRVVPAAGGASLLVYVELGIGGGAPIDPGACGAARRAEARRLAAGRPVVLTGALRRLDGMKDTVAGLQTLRVLVRLRGHAAMPGGGVPVRPGGRLAAGVVASGSLGKGQRVLAVIAGPQTAIVKASGGARRIAVADGLYVLRVARGRAAAVHELDARGRMLRTRRVA